MGSIRDTIDSSTSGDAKYPCPTSGCSGGANSLDDSSAWEEQEIPGSREKKYICTECGSEAYRFVPGSGAKVIR